ncbi:hypothetical protein, partial [Corynebacterium sp. HMSC29G08]|uniref:hypothetical protein n=1 Tax=Corynebacterium sp. HMSC29G08 TaxID=1581069 RepID=UPI00143B4E0A
AAYETTYLSAFAPRASTQLAATVPAFVKLIPDLDHVPGDPFDIRDISHPTAPSFERSPLPKVIQDSFIAFGHKDLAYATTPDEVIDSYGQINPDVLEAIQAGATNPSRSTQLPLHATDTYPRPTWHTGTSWFCRWHAYDLSWCDW